MAGEPALVGRESELTRLSETVDQVVSGTGQAVLVEGEPGIGKSSVVKSVAELGVRRGCQVYWAAADELGRDLPLRPLIDALREPTPAGQHRLATIGRLLRGEVPGGIAPVVAASEQMLTLVTELCDAAPTILVVDDLQWADLATVGVWERLARSADRTSLLLIGIMRPVPQRDELAALRRSVGAATVIRLEGLTAEAVTELVAQVAGGVPGDDLLRLAAGAAGNPLYLTELLDALIRADRLTWDAAGTVGVDDGPIPDSLTGAITDRLDFVSSEVRTILRAAALFGGEFLVSDLAIVVNHRVADLVRPIDIACTARILKVVGDKLSFRHPLIRTALYDGIPVAIRPAWHRDAARALAGAGAPVDRVAPHLLRSVASGAGPLDDSLLGWLAEAASTLVALAPKTAIDLLREACRHCPPATPRGSVLAARLAAALYRAGEGVEAERVAHRALAVVADPDLAVDLHWTAAQCRMLAGRADESLAMLKDAVAELEMTKRQRARMLVLTARAHRAIGEVSVARGVAAEALTIAEDVGDPWAIGWSLHMVIIVSMMGGDVAAALPLFARALDVVGGDPALTDLGLLLRINEAVALGDLDRYEEALAAARRVRRLADDSGNLVRLAQAQTALGEIQFEAGHWNEALAEVETLPDDFKDPGMVCCDRGFSAIIAFRRGDPDTARSHLRRVADSATQIGSRVVSSSVLARSLDYEVAGHPAEALDVLATCITGDAEELDEMEDLLPAAARLAALVGETGVLADVARKAADLAGVPHRLGAAAYCAGLRDSDADQLRQAATHYANRPLLKAEALEAAAIQLVRDGDRDAARTAFLDADDLYQQLGAEWDLNRLRAELRAHGFRRGSRAKRRQVRTGWESLTPTESRVAEMVAGGMSNRVIAERLVLSIRTIDTHVSHILAKLEVRSRLDIARVVDRRTYSP